MSESIVPISSDIIALLEQWKQAQRNGEKFPVPFETAWVIAGYSRKDVAKRDGLSGLKVGKHFSTEKWKNGQRGRSKEIIMLSLDAFKHLCLMANTDEGEVIRDYFIDAEEKWQITQQIAPQVANEVEMMHMKIELAKIEAQKEFAIAQAKQADLQLVQFRHAIVSTAPEYIQQKVLGFSVVEKVEYRDRIVDQSGQALNDGSTVTKKELCDRLGLRTKNGAPDYKRLNVYLDKLPHVAFDTVAYFQENRQLRRDWISNLEAMVDGSDRQRWLGE